ncbi:MAG: class I tRNA ligase family protein [Saprospiraceae bacterium]
MDYNHKEIEDKWRTYWFDKKINKVENDFTKPKYYVLDMFPYPSGSGLHVGHPLGYIASDIIARHKKMQGFNVLHPMGFDAFGLPAEQYAIQTGIHPIDSTKINMQRYRDQLNNIGLNYDWSREVITCEPKYYKWTQWIFLKLFNHYYNLESQKAEPIEELIKYFSSNGNTNSNAYPKDLELFTAEEWNAMNAVQKDHVLMNYRLAYRKKSYVNWCEALGTVLANDEIKDGVSERGGHAVEKKAMMQWALRITAYCDRLLNDLQSLDWSDSMKNMQRNWIGKSSGAQLFFDIDNSTNKLEIFTTRPDTIFGVGFMVIAPEHEFVNTLTTAEQQKVVEDYKEYVASRSDLDRLAETKSVTGVFTGSYCIHPFTKEKIPIWISEYVLIDYGTGAIMGVPAHDSRDLAFANKFGLNIIQVVDQSEFPNVEPESKQGKLINSDFINGLDVQDAIEKVIVKITKEKIGHRKNQYRMRDANFSRQRYWGEPFPIYYDNEEVCHSISENELPLLLPYIEKISTGTEGKSPLIHATEWAKPKPGYSRELDTMPGYAGSSWYFLRFMDPDNESSFASKEALDYWGEVDLYIGGTEHAVGHLMYARFWHKFLFDLKYVSTIEPFMRLVNQGMIQGIIENILLVKETSPTQFISASLRKNYREDQLAYIPVHLGFVKNANSPESQLDKGGVHEFVKWKPDYAESIFTDETGSYKLDELNNNFSLKTISEVGKMSKRYHNVVNPDEVVAEYGADVFRMYEMFLGPLEDSKPWDTKGITGVSGFLRKYYRMFFDEQSNIALSEESPSKEELKILHTCIKKVNEDIKNLSFNTCISSFMICVNELRRLNSNNKIILSQLNLLLAPFAPFITEELFNVLGGKGSVHQESYPFADERYLITDEVNYPVSVNGKKRYEWLVSKNKTQTELESEVLQIEEIKKWIQDSPIKKIIFVPGRMINIVI